MARKLKDWLESYQQYTDETESAEIFNKWVGLSTLAAALQRKIWLQSGRHRIFPNLFVILVAEPGGARKSTSLSYGEELLLRVPNVKIAANSTSPQALLDDIQQALGEDQLPTGEGLRHNSLSIISGEFEVFLGDKKENSKMIITLTDFFDCSDRPFRKRTRHCGDTTIEAVWLNILGATTPESIATTLPIAAIGGGLTSRIIYVWSEGSTKKFPIPEWNEDLRSLQEDLIHDLTIISRMSGTYNYTPQSRQWWIDWYNRYNPRDPTRICKEPAFIHWYSRKPLYLQKLSIILAASESNELYIHPRHFERALKLILEAEEMMGKTFNAVGRSAVAADVSFVMTLIENYRLISEKQLMQLSWKDIDSKKFDNVISTVIRTGKVRREWKGPNGETGMPWFRWIDGGNENENKVR